MLVDYIIDKTVQRCTWCCHISYVCLRIYIVLFLTLHSRPGRLWKKILSRRFMIIEHILRHWGLMYLTLEDNTW